MSNGRKSARTLFVLVLLSMGIYLLAYAWLKDSGPDSIVLILPWMLMVFVHGTLGLTSVGLALVQKQYFFAAIVTTYLLAVALHQLHAFGVTAEIAERTERSYLEQTQPSDYGLVVLLDQHHPDPAQVARLVNAGADVNRIRPDGHSALVMAAGKSLELTQALLEHGANPNFHSDNGTTPFHRAVINKQFDAALALARAGTDPNIEDGSGKTAFCALLNRVSPKDPLTDHRNLIEQLLTPNTIVTGDCPALSTALRRQQVEFAKLMIDAGHALTKQEIEANHSTLAAAIKQSNAPLIDLCLRAGVQPTPHLRRAVEQNDAALVEILLTHGADASSGFYLQYSAIKPERDRVTELLLQHGADPAVKDDKGRNALVAALRGSHTANIKRFVELGLDVNDTYQGEPLIHAFYTLEDRKKDLPALLLELGADPNAKNDQGMSLVFVALKNAHQALLSAAIAHGADLTVFDDKGWHIIHHAANTRWEGAESMQRLIEAGIDINLLTQSGETPLCIAKRHRHKVMVAFLEQKNALLGDCEE